MIGSGTAANRDTINLEPFLAEILDLAIAISGADFGNIQLIDPQTSNLRIVAQRGFAPWWLNFWDAVAVGHGVCGTALERGERVIVEDVEQSPILVGTPALEMQRRAGVRAVQSTPIVTKDGQPLGMFSTHFRAPHRPDDRTLGLLDLLASHAAETIARTRSEQRAALEQLETQSFVNISHELRTPLTLVLGTVDRMLAEPELSNARRRELDVIARNSRLLRGLVDDFLGVSELDAGRVQLGYSEAGLAASARRSQEVPRGVAAGPRVLVVENDPDMRFFICECLAESCRLSTADNGRDALAQAIESTPDLVVIDIMLPQMHGDELVAAFRERAELAEVPIIVLTARTDEALRVQLLCSGAQDYLIKPFLPEELRARVANLLNAKLARDALHANEIRLCQEREIFELGRRTEAELRRAAAVFTATNDAVVITDAEHRIVAVNEAFTRITGFSEGDVINETPEVQRSERHEAAFYEHIWEEAREKGQWQGEIWNRRKNGEAYPVWENISAVKNEHGEVVNFIDVFSDIGPIKATQEELAHMAHHDALTGLPNRLLFSARLDQTLEHAKRSGKRAAVLLLDLDRFKLINDTLGHGAGDRVLEIVAQRCKACVRAEDTVARLGGDEYAFVLQEIAHAQDAALVAQNVLEQIRMPIELDGRKLMTAGSIGICVYPDDGMTGCDLVKAADAAMYRAKRKKDHTFQFYTVDLTLEAEAHLALELELPGALAQEELELHYQPQLDLTTDAIVGVEALLRWMHPTRGAISPEQIIQIAEESGFMPKLEKWIITSAIRQAAVWSELQLPLMHVSINLSGRQLASGTVIPVLQEALRQTQLGGWRVLLDVEVAESGISALDDSAMVLRQLRELGVGIALDEFGSGHFSLYRLKSLPIDIVKIDRGYIRNIPQDGTDCAITSGFIALARDLGLKVVAEGVERPEQLEFLRSHHCDAAQGFLISKPLNARETTLFLTHSQNRRKSARDDTEAFT